MTARRPFEIGVFTFGEITADPTTGRPLAPSARLRDLTDLAKLADEAGLDVAAHRSISVRSSISPTGRTGQPSI